MRGGKIRRKKKKEIMSSLKEPHEANLAHCKCFASLNGGSMEPLKTLSKYATLEFHSLSKSEP